MYDNDDHATVITLGPHTDQADSVSFEQAFGEYSNLHGRGRARRAKRKAERQKNRQAKRMTRIENRQERKSTRKSNRQGNRQNRIEARLKRKATRQDAKGGDDVVPSDEEESTSDVLPTTAGNSDTDSQDSGPGTAVEETSAPDTGDDGGENEVTGYADETPEEVPADADEEDLGFSGEEADSAFNAEVNGARDTGTIKIHPAVMDNARKIVWNEAMAQKYTKQLANGAGDPAEIQSCIDGHNERISELEGMMDGYSNARGGRGGKMAARREMHAAKHAAKKQMRQQRRAAKKAGPTDSGAGATDPIVSAQADQAADQASEFSGTNQPGNVIDITSNASGPGTMSVNTKNILIGVGVAVGIIALLKITKVV